MACALWLAGAMPAQADCPNVTFTCALGDQFTMGSSLVGFQCQTLGSVLGAAIDRCQNPGCNDVGTRADGCSVPASEPQWVRDAANTIFHSACDLHDLCYSTKGTTQAQCDERFRSNMYAICGMPGIGGTLGHSGCIDIADRAYQGVVDQGASSFTSNQVWASSHCNPPPTNKPVWLRGKQSGKTACIDRAEYANGVRTHLWDYLAVPDQEWVISPVSGEYYSLRVQHSKKCLDVAGGTQENGGKLQQWDCVNNDNQKWRFEKQSDGSFFLRAKASGKFLDVAGWGTANDTTVQQWELTGADNQRWYIDDVVLPPTGVPVKIRGKQSGKVACISGAQTANGVYTHLWDYVGLPDQQWKIEDDGGGYYRLKVQHTQKCLDLSSGSQYDGARVQQWDCANTDNQRWRIEKQSDGAWVLRPKASGHCLDAAGYGTQNGTVVQQWSCTGVDNQRWYIDAL